MEDSENVETMYLYTEKATNLIYEVQFFDNFVLVRPVNPAFHSAVYKFDLKQFAQEYEEFQGDWQQVRRFIADMDPREVVIIH